MKNRIDLAYCIDALIPGVYIWIEKFSIRLWGCISDDSYSFYLKTFCGIAIVLPGFHIISTPYDFEYINSEESEWLDLSVAKVLSRRDSIAVLRMMNEPPQPNEKLRKLLSTPYPWNDPTIPIADPWLDNNQEARESVERALESAKQNKAEYLGSFAEYADLDIDDDDPVILCSFLDLLSKDIEENPSKLVPYTQEMHDQYMALIEGVKIDDDGDIESPEDSFKQGRIECMTGQTISIADLWTDDDIEAYNAFLSILEQRSELYKRLADTD